MRTINLKIAELRKEMGLTQQELGDILSVSFQTISKWENGVTLPDITILPMLSDFFLVYRQTGPGVGLCLRFRLPGVNVAALVTRGKYIHRH